MDSMKHIGVWMYRENRSVIDKLVQFFTDRGIAIYSMQHFVYCPAVTTLSLEDYVRTVNITIILGGDGTMLAAARVLAPFGMGLVGLNLGHKGFLAEISAENVDACLTKLLHGEYFIEERMMLSVQVGNVTMLALNDIALSRCEPVKMTRIRAYIDNHPASRYEADAILVATPTGSTAYSLSAGGPLVDPRVDAMLLTPVASHSFYTRPILVPGNAVFSFTTADDSPLLVTADGQERIIAATDDSITVTKSSIYTKLIKIGQDTLYDTLRAKMSGGKYGTMEAE